MILSVFFSKSDLFPSPLYKFLFNKTLAEYFCLKSFRTLMIKRDSPRPVLVQLAANDAEIFKNAAKVLTPYCDGVDLNLGCPQHIARKGGYGAFLMNGDWSLISNIISAGKEHAPITVKIRVFESIPKTIEYATEIARSGAVALTVHGRRIDQKKAG